MIKKILIGSLSAAFLVYLFYFTCGVFVVQPIGAIPNGASVLFLRAGLDLPFISSIDGILLKKMGSVNLIGRAMGMAKISPQILDRKIIIFPYSESLYLVSTDGVKFDE